jgi:hypothetical protein
MKTLFLYFFNGHGCRRPSESRHCQAQVFLQCSALLDTTTFLAPASLSAVGEIAKNKGLYKKPL